MLRIYLYSLTLYFISMTVHADELAPLQALLPSGTNVAYMIGQPFSATEDITSNIISQQNTELLLTPASTQKLLTALTAKLYLTDKYTFNTSLHGAIKQQSISDTEFNFTGDPTFTREDLRGMLKQLKAKGITRINGDISLNQSRFNGYNWGNGQVWNDQAVCYATQASALVINGNCVLGNLKRSADLKKATIYIPDYEPLSLVSEVDIMTKEQQQAQFCDLEVTRHPGNNYTLFGCITPSKRNLPLSFAISEPATYFSAVLKAELSHAKIKFTGNIVENQQTITSALVLNHESVPLATIITEMMKESDNLIADILFKTIGAEYFQQPGNYRNGAKAMHEILADKGISLTSSVIADGSGLSRHNLVSAETMFSVLAYTIKHDDKLQLLATMPIAGVDGTLQYRRGLLTKQLTGNIVAKTGSLKGLSNLVGIVKTQKNHMVPFVLMVSGYNPLPRDAEQPRQASPITQYSAAFFNMLVTEY
ncbi:D-alanyl-D-alanine carboxypeptidase/D-alanyl-D-alanine-endopeptidase [Moritella sp. F3]|uniref:D-alanyl-D-alanine carboxypeptidase/D-alanyl-D-alanine endopeptidase n=1 Tax=Moritella sp. F3 TaxID=2718882 RepID=UPI001F555E73|nr:D-alanyl-D-alanine carboxypeptidase/D-alanyl-D-alanine-endopeptidase [Moritella sp. F3]